MRTYCGTTNGRFRVGFVAPFVGVREVASISTIAMRSKHGQELTGHFLARVYAHPFGPQLVARIIKGPR